MDIRKVHTVRRAGKAMSNPDEHDMNRGSSSLRQRGLNPNDKGAMGLLPVESYTSSVAADGITSFNVWAPTEGSDLPVMLFQSGYGSSSAGHQFFCKKVAAAGFIGAFLQFASQRFKQSVFIDGG